MGVLKTGSYDHLDLSTFLIVAFVNESNIFNSPDEQQAQNKLFIRYLRMNILRYLQIFEFHFDLWLCTGIAQ
jgi:hypothetical protein